MPKIRTTMRPDEELDVSDQEADHLRAIGVLLEGTKATTEQGLLKAAERQVAASTPEQPEG